MKFSIIIVNWKTPKLTLECVRSIYKYQPKFSFEVIIVDNGSGDDSVEQFEKFAMNKKNLIVVESRENVGFARGNNLGLEKSKGEYKLLLNSDTKVTKGAIDELVKFAEEHDDAGVVVSRLLNKDGSIQASAFRTPTIERNVQQWWLGKRDLLDKYFPKGKDPVKVEVVVMAAYLITPKAYEKVGGLNGKYFMYYEDFDYCREVHKAGLNIYYLPKSEVYHLHGVSGKNIASANTQWRRLLRGSKIYHGFIRHYLILFIQRSSDIFRRRVLKKLK